jgi:hypothetical protein
MCVCLVVDGTTDDQYLLKDRQEEEEEEEEVWMLLSLTGTKFAHCCYRAV